MGGKVFRALALGICLVAVTQAANATTMLDELKAKRQEIKDKEAMQRDEISNTQKNISDQEQTLEAVQGQISDLTSKCQLAEKDLKALSKAVKNLQEEIVAREENLVDTKKEFFQYLKIVYKADAEMELLEQMVSSVLSPSYEQVDRAELIRRVGAKGQQLLEEIRAQIKTISEKRAKLDKKRQKAAETLEQLDRAKEKLVELRAENEKQIASLQSTKKNQTKILAKYEAQEQAIQVKIDQAIEEAARKESGTSEAQIKSSGKGWHWPTISRHVTSPFGENRGHYVHSGIDFGGKHGDPIFAVDNGVVIVASQTCTHDYGKLRSCGCGGGYGNWVAILHADGVVSIYGHLSRVFTKKGATVNRGDKIGEEGSTGWSTGVHLHFGVKKGGRNVDPNLFL